MNDRCIILKRGMLKGLSTVFNNIPTHYLISGLNKIDTKSGQEFYRQFDSYNIAENELQSRFPEDATQLYFGIDDIILPFQLYDENGYEIIEPVAYENGEPIW